MNCFEISNSTLAIKTVRLLMFSCPRTTHVLCANLRREYNDSLVSNNCSNQLWPILTRFFFQNYNFLNLEICMKGRTFCFSGTIIALSYNRKVIRTVKIFVIVNMSAKLQGQSDTNLIKGSSFKYSFKEITLLFGD